MFRGVQFYADRLLSSSSRIGVSDSDGLIVSAAWVIIIHSAIPPTCGRTCGMPLEFMLHQKREVGRASEC